MIQPLANRVLIKPDPPPDQTASGFIIPDNAIASKDFDMSGTVVAKGHGPASAALVRAAMIDRFRRLVEQAEDAMPSSGVCAHLMRAIGEMEIDNIDCSEIAVGDHVAFPYTAGTVLDVDGDRYLLMNEDQIVAVLSRPDEVSA